MSGIVGLLNTGGVPCDRRVLERMLQGMAHRARDGSSFWQQGNFGLGYGHLRTSHSDIPPVFYDNIALAADARLDNRDDLIRSLYLDDNTLSDASLIVAAYRRWGEECPAHLLGDFAFGLWDVERDLLFCARDHFGIKPFYYSTSLSRFIFGSEIKALCVVGSVSDRIDEERIADFLVGRVTDEQTTIFPDIRRLPPRHSLTVSTAGVKLRSYWELGPSSSPLKADYVHQFKALFSEAVRSRLRGIGPIGAMLSGGLDSSSIACVAATILGETQRAPLRTVSLVFDKTPSWSERPFIEAVLACGNFEPTFVNGDDYAPFDDFTRVLAEQESAYLAPGLALTRKLYRRAADLGIRVLLDGHGGDEVVSHGYGRLSELASSGRLLALWRESRAIAAVHKSSFWPLFVSYVRRSPYWRFLSVVGAGVRQVRRASCGARPNSQFDPIQFLNPDLVRRTNVVTRLREAQRRRTEVSRTEQARHANVLSSAIQSYAFEVMDKAAAAVGIEPRYPFWDKRLVEFCLALPASEKLDKGWSRFILRRAMQGILPEKVRWRRDKLGFAPHLIRGMLLHHRSLLDNVFLRDAPPIQGYVQLPKVRAAYQRIVEKAEAADGYDVQAVWRCAVLALWLRELDTLPSPSASAREGSPLMDCMVPGLPANLG